MTLAHGTVLGRYRIAERIGAGGMGEVRAYASHTAVPYDLAIALSGGDDADGVIENLSAAYELHAERLYHAPFEPKFDRFREEPRFSALMERLRERVALPARTS